VGVPVVVDSGLAYGIYGTAGVYLACHDGTPSANSSFSKAWQIVHGTLNMTSDLVTADMQPVRRISVWAETGVLLVLIVLLCCGGLYTRDIVEGWPGHNNV